LRGRKRVVAENRIERLAGPFPLVDLEPIEDRLLVGEVLVERADADAGRLGHANRGEALRPFALENANSGLQDGRDELGGPGLNGLSSRRGRGAQ
jgi:hypothetical protein